MREKISPEIQARIKEQQQKNIDKGYHPNDWYRWDSWLLPHDHLVDLKEHDYLNPKPTKKETVKTNVNKKSKKKKTETINMFIGD